MRRVSHLLPVVFLASTGSTAPTAEMRAVGATFVLVTSSGERLTGQALVGATFALADRHGARQLLRIEEASQDPHAKSDDVWLYRLSARLPSGEWTSFCEPGADGVAMGFPVETSGSADGSRRFSLTCTSGAVGKCVRMGYKPWATAPDGTPLRPHHEACVRMVRGDYCGDGRSFTRDGTVIDVYDRLRVQEAENIPTMSFEAAWSPEGAVCVSRTRIPAAVGTAALARLCPARLDGRLGPKACDPGKMFDDPAALVFNRSTPLAE